MSGVAVERDPSGALAAASRRAVRRALAVRLDDIGQLPDWLTPEARRAVFTYAQGGKNRLQMVLATALFLAEKEHRTRVDLALVQRAAAMQTAAPRPVLRPETVRADAPVPAQRARVHWDWVTAGVLVLAFAGLGVRWVASHQARQGAAQTAVIGDVSMAAQAPAAPKAVVLHGLATLTALAPPLPVAAPAWQPADPPALVTLRFSRSAHASDQARLIQQNLQGAGFTVVLSPERRHARGKPASLHYFYAEDAEAAARVQHALALATTPTQSHGAARVAPPQPGTIELFLP